MTNVRKKNGKSERFDRTKIERSIRDSGADERTAKEVARMVPEKEDTTSEEVRRAVARELRKRNAKFADNYDATRRLAASKAIDAAKGTAHITEDAMKGLNVRKGDTIELIHGEKRHTVKVERTTPGEMRIHLNESDLKVLGAPEGARVSVQRRK